MPSTTPRHTFLATLVALVACGGPGPAPAPAPAAVARLLPSTHRYQIVERRHVEQHYQGQSVVTDATTRMSLSVAITDGPTGLLADVIVDSAEVEGDAGVAAAVARGVAGSRFRASLLPTGVMGPVDAPATTNALLDQIALGLPELIPHLPPDGAAPESVWHDTTMITGRTAMLPISLDVQAEHRAGSWSDHDGDRVLPIITVSRYTLSGEGERAGQWLSMTGMGRSGVRRLLTADGAVTHAIRYDTLHVTIELGSGLQIPLTQTRTDSVRRVLP